MVVLGMHAVKREMRLDWIVTFQRMHLLDERTSGKVAIDDNLKDVIVQIVAPEIP